MATNLKGPFYLTAALAPQMAARGVEQIINITTMAAHIGLPQAPLYGATKAALTLLTKAWATEFASDAAGHGRGCLYQRRRGPPAGTAQGRRLQPW
ncbi:MAG TPA: SDR family NAD(P)-dependent oxidoreductase [Ktedonobacterales bacterium]